MSHDSSLFAQPHTIGMRKPSRRVRQQQHPSPSDGGRCCHCTKHHLKPLTK